jgi:DNA-binding NtrC family response regulator
MADDKYPIDPVLIVDNEKAFIDLVEKNLRERKPEVITNIKICKDGSTLKSLGETDKYSFILFNMSIFEKDGKEMAIKILDSSPKIPVILISSDESRADAVNYMKQGALYYYIKGKIDQNKLIDQILQGIRLYESIKPIVTRSKKMRPIFRDIGRIAQTDITVLIRGETGVGKELVAEAIHTMSDRKGKYVKMNITSFDDTLFADALFGHVRGAFDGAKTDRNGLIEEARGGTVFLDEIGDLHIDSQARLLRLLQDGTYYKLGSDKEIKADTRVIAATNRNIEDDIQKGISREDFFQRVKGYTIFIPPLRERKEDIPLLIDHFIEKTSQEHNLTKPIPGKKLIEEIKSRNFKGNIKELAELIRKLVIQFPGFEELTPEMLEGLDENIVIPPPPPVKGEESKQGLNFPTFIEIEASYYRELLIRTDKDQTKAAKIADLERRTFNNRLKSINDKLREKGKCFDEIPRLTELVKLFPA